MCLRQAGSPSRHTGAACRRTGVEGRLQSAATDAQNDRVASYFGQEVGQSLCRFLLRHLRDATCESSRR